MQAVDNVLPLLGDWVRWELGKEITGKYYVDTLFETINEFVISLSLEDDTIKIQLIFRSSVYAYRSTDESFRVKTFHELSNKYETGFYGPSTFFKVNNSPYINMLNKQRISDVRSKTLTHFALVAGDSVVDIVADCDPIIRVL